MVCVSSAKVSEESVTFFAVAPACNPRTRTGISTHSGLAEAAADAGLGFRIVGEEDVSAPCRVCSILGFVSVLIALPGGSRPSGMLNFSSIEAVSNSFV
jgi:hypothetical protein